MDLDGGAVEVTQLSLYLKMLENENRTTLKRERELFADDVALLPPLQDNIKRGNSLISSNLLDGVLPTDETINKLNAVHAFDWPVQFPAIIKVGGFDAIIGNPPYVRPHNLSDDDKEYFWKHYETFTHKSDLYCCFIEQSTRLLRESGLFSYIVSRGWLRLNSFQELRKLFLSKYQIYQLVDLPDNVFEDAQVSTCIFVVEKDRSDKKSATEVAIINGALTKTGPQFTLIRKIPQSTFHKTFQNVFDISISPETESIKDKMRRGPTIGSLYRVCFGLKTGDDSKFLHHLKGLHPDDERLLRGEDVKRYDYEWKGEYVWYVPSRMRDHRPTARPGEPARFEQPKLLVKDTTTDFAGTYDAKNFYVKDVLIVIPQDSEKHVFDLRYVTGIVNSPALKFYYRSTFKTIHVQCEELGSLPLPPIDLKRASDKTRHDKLVGLVDKMLVLTQKLRTATSDSERATLQNAVTSTDQQIDQLVYELYGLTPEEIALVEGAK
ncbi:MAG: hypothetical protein EXS18_07185 [Verrucomicrobiae bacterium]|nr:hypothetical protein [Verrucomicrobiae bacterium]